MSGVGDLQNIQAVQESEVSGFGDLQNIQAVPGQQHSAINRNSKPSLSAPLSTCPSPFHNRPPFTNRSPAHLPLNSQYYKSRSTSSHNSDHTPLSTLFFTYGTCCIDTVNITVNTAGVATACLYQCTAGWPQLARSSVLQGGHSLPVAVYCRVATA